MTERSRVVLRRRLVPPPSQPWPDDVPPLLQRILAARGADAAALRLDLAGLQPPGGLSHLDAAVGLLHQALQQQRRIVVVADFDADGATACAVAVRGLRLLGACDVHYRVPNRFRHHYGLSPELAQEAIEAGAGLIVTVDNGISSHAGVEVARQAGVPVLITDHHQPGADLPRAVVVNPNLHGDGFPSKHLAGVGVIYYVLLALRRHLVDCGHFNASRPAPNFAALLDLVALGTVADVVRLDGNNRILVAQGLRRLRAGQCVPGLRALAEVGGRDLARLTAGDLGFVLGPRLNAAGRLDDMALGIECLLTDDLETARAHAQRLHDLNLERREVEGRMVEEALALAEIDGLPTSGCSLTLFRPDWHSGVIGLVAARLRERLNRPVLALAPFQDGLAKGSGRSVPVLHLRDALADVDTAHPGLIRHFGGHAAAAGLTVAVDDLDRLAVAFEEACARRLAGMDCTDVLWSDGELQAEELTLATARLLSAAGPWGQGFPEPMFDGWFVVESCRVLKERHLRLNLRPAGGGPVVEGIAFNAVAGAGVPEPGQRWRLAYTLEASVWRDNERLQLNIRHIEA